MATKVKSVPAAARTFNALRDFGYNLDSALADILDNSISRGKAKHIELVFAKDKAGKFFILVYDDGCGMKPGKLEEAMRIGSEEDYEEGDLSKYGMGMKTASLSQCHNLTVLSKAAQTDVSGYKWDMHHIRKANEWDLFRLSGPEAKAEINEAKKRFKQHKYPDPETFFNRRSWTLVIWDDLKEFQTDYDSYTSTVAADNFYYKTIDDLSIYLRLVFGRFLSGENGVKKISLSLNGKKLKSFDPFCRSEPHTREMELSPKNGDFRISDSYPPIVIKRYILPSKTGRERFSSESAWAEARGAKKWNDAQGYYVYRNNRLIMFGGWFGTKGKDEHEKLARVSIDITNEHDDLFTLDVKKTRIRFPEVLKNHLIDHVNKGYLKAARQRYDGDRIQATVSNKVRDKHVKVNTLSDELIQKEQISVKQARSGRAVVINNKSGETIVDDITYKTIQKGIKIASARLNDPCFWKMVPIPDNDFQVLINENHPFYQEVYGNHENDRKVTAIMDAFLFTMSFTELKCITKGNELLFDQIREVASSVLKKFVDEKIL